MPIELLVGKREPPFSFRWLFFGAAGAIVALLFYLGSQPMAIGLFPEPLDKLAHLGVFGSIAVLLWFATSGQKPLTIIGVIAVIGALDELHQGGLSGRSMDYLDFLADVSAAIIVVIVLSLTQK